MLDGKTCKNVIRACAIIINKKSVDRSKLKLNTLSGLWRVKTDNESLKTPDVWQELKIEALTTSFRTSLCTVVRLRERGLIWLGWDLADTALDLFHLPLGEMMVRLATMITGLENWDSS